MDFLSCYAILTYSPKSSYYSTPNPSMLFLAGLIDLENRGVITCENTHTISITHKDDSLPKHLQCCISLMKKKDAYTIPKLLDTLLRGFTYSNLSSYVYYAMEHISKSFSEIERKKRKFLVPDTLKRQAQSNLRLMLLNSNSHSIILAALLFGARELDYHIDKNEYNSVLELLNNNQQSIDKPLAKYIVENVDRIRGHIMGIVAN